MHLTISVVPLTFADLITKALSSISKADIEFRQHVPWSIEADGKGLEELTKQAKQCIAKLADQLDVSSLIDSERRLLQGEPRGSSSGELESAIASLLETAASRRRSNDGQQLDNTSMAVPED